MPRPVCRLFVALIFCALCVRAADDAAAAEKKLRAELQANPNDAETLSRLGAALDQQKRFREADAAHRQAIANAPRDAAILNRYADHLRSAGEENAAREAYGKVIAIDPANINANLQLARLALQQKNPEEALAFLNRLPAHQQESPAAAALRMKALYQAGNRAEADAWVARWSDGDAALSSSVGLALADAGQFEQAETFLTRALSADPASFRALYNLGVVASFAGHHERARDVLQTALRQQPENVDALYSLAYVHEELKQREEAVRLLVRAARLAPARADVQKLLAIATTELQAWADAAAAWDRYLKLESKDDFARREHGFTLARAGRFEQGVAELKSFLALHPQDADGHYELGLVEKDPQQSLAYLSKAAALNPDSAEARAARGSLYYQQGKAEAALPDLEFAAARQPDNATTLDRLGQTYAALERPADALRVLRRAAALAPGDPRIQLHLGRALAEAGEVAESKSVMESFRQLSSNKDVVPAGLVEYLGLTPDEQRADYRARVEKALRNNPADAAAQLRYLRLSLADGKMEAAAGAAHRIAALKPGAAVLAEAGRALLEARQYTLAKELLEQTSGVELELAIATYHAAGPAQGLVRMESVPQAARGGDYYLARVQMLSASGKFLEAAAVPDGPAVPPSREIQLLKAIALEVAGRGEDSRHLLAEAQNRWPEWYAVWVARGIILATSGNFAEARRALETAVALGARSPEVYFYLAESNLQATPSRIDAAEAAIRQARKRAPEDRWTKALAGRIAARKAGSGAESQPDSDPPPYLRRLLDTRLPREW